MMPPGSPRIGLGLACFLTTLMPSTSTCSGPTRRSTTPRRFLSLPARTITSSPLMILFIALSLQHFRRERHNLHESLGAKFARHRSENPRADRFKLGVEQYGRIAAEANERTVFAAHALRGTHHDGVVDFAFFDASAGSCLFYGHLDDVANGGVA